MKKTLNYFLLFTSLVLFDNQLFGQYYWTKDVRNPIFAGGDSSWNKNIFQPRVLFNADSERFEMWFGASAGNTDNYGRPYRIGFAVSDDGITWTMHPTPVLSPDQGTWDEFTVEEPTVIRENGQYKMWYTGGMSIAITKIGYATSPDGISWTKYAGNPIIEPGTSAWEVGGPLGNSVMPVAEGYKMWYSAYEVFPSNTTRIGYATSVDGIVWQKDTLNNPVLTLGESGQWDDYAVLLPYVQYLDTTYYMWYTGAKLIGGWEQVGLATSSDGIVWTKYTQNPVLVRLQSEWDESWIEAGTVMLIDYTFHMWYAGRNGSNLWRIGHATAPVTEIIENEIKVTQNFSLKQNYPNPFNPTTTIEFDIPIFGFVSLKVYNIMGQEVSTLVNKELSSGNHKVEWKPENLSSGLYFYKLATKGYQETKKLIFMK